MFNAGFGAAPETGDATAQDGGPAEGPSDGGPAEGPEDPETAEPLAEIGKAMAKNMEIFAGYEVPPVARYTPDIAALQASSTRIMMAVGAASEGTPMYRASVALAGRLGTTPVVFPGDHGGFGSGCESSTRARSGGRCESSSSLTLRTGWVISGYRHGRETALAPLSTTTALASSSELRQSTWKIHR